METRTIEFGSLESHFLADLLEVTALRQRNYIAYQSISLSKIMEKINEAKAEISSGKKSYFSSPESRLKKLEPEKEYYEKEISSTKFELKKLRHLYNTIMHADFICDPAWGDKRNVGDVFKEPNGRAYSKGGFKKYHYQSVG